MKRAWKDVFKANRDEYLAEDGKTMPLPAGQYESEDGVGFSVEEEGIVAEIYEEEAEEDDDMGRDDDDYTEEVEASEEDLESAVEEVEDPSDLNGRKPKKIKTTEEIEFNKEALIEEIGVVIKELLSEVKDDLSRLSAELDEIKGVNENLEVEKETLSAQLEELSKEPAADPVVSNKFSDDKSKDITPVEFRNMTRQEKYWYNINKNK